MAILVTPRISTNLFRYNPESGFIAEASELGDRLRLSRVFDDACDAGFTLVSAKTGREMPMVHTASKLSKDGELEVEVFSPVRRKLRDDRRFQVRIYND